MNRFSSCALVAVAVSLSSCSGGGNFDTAQTGPAPAVSMATVQAEVQANLAQYPAVISLTAIGPIVSYVVPEANSGVNGTVSTLPCDQATTATATFGTSATTFSGTDYYDAACTMPWESFTGKDVVTQGGYVHTITATGTVYASNGVGALTESLNLIQTTTQTNTETSATINVASSGQTFGFDCIDSAGDLPFSETCSYGSVMPLSAGAPAPAIATASSLVDQLAPGGIGGSGSMTVASGDASTIALSDSQGAFTVSGAASSAAYEQSVDIQYSTAVSPIITISSSPNNAQSGAGGTFSNFSATGGASESYGPLSDPGTATLATYTFDLFGNGSITFKNGSTATISNFVIVAPNSSATAHGRTGIGARFRPRPLAR